MNELIDRAKKIIKKSVRKYKTLILIITFIFILLMNTAFSHLKTIEPLRENTKIGEYTIAGNQIYYAGSKGYEDSIYYLFYLKDWDQKLIDLNTEINFQENYQDINSKKNFSEIFYNKQGFLFIKVPYEKNYVSARLDLFLNTSKASFYSNENVLQNIKSINQKDLIEYTIDTIIKIEERNIVTIEDEIKVFKDKQNEIITKIKEIQELDQIYSNVDNFISKEKALENDIIDKENEKITIKNYIEILKSEKIFHLEGKKVSPKVYDFIETKNEKVNTSENENKVEEKPVDSILNTTTVEKSEEKNAAKKEIKNYTEESPEQPNVENIIDKENEVKEENIEVINQEYQEQNLPNDSVINEETNEDITIILTP